MRRLSVTAAGFGLFFFCGGAMAGTPIKVVLMGGQSNMDGWALTSGLSTQLQNPQPDVLIYNASPGVTPVQLQALQPQGTNMPGGTFGPEITFGRKLADDNPGQRYALIKYAYGGSSLNVDWRATAPVGAQYTIFKNTVTAGLQALTNAGYTPQITGMLWLQGETDAAWSAAWANAYQQNLTDFISDVRATYGPNLPFVIGGIGYITPVAQRNTVMTAQATIAASTPKVAYFNNDDLNAQHNMHYDTAQMQVVGQRFATSFESVVPEPGSIAAIVVGSCTLATRRNRK